MHQEHVPRYDAIADTRFETEHAPQYRCLVCGETYNHELLARVHVTRAADAEHDGIDGFDAMEYVPIEVLDVAGNELHPLLAARDREAATELSLNAIPTESERYPARFEDQHRWILVAAARHVDANGDELVAHANGLLAERDREPVDPHVVGAVVRAFFEPQRDEIDRPAVV